MTLLQIAILALIQGLTELLPVSSSAHVILAEKWMGLDPTLPRMTLLLVMLHTGTMLSVLVYFWETWRKNYFESEYRGGTFIKKIIQATLATGLVGALLMFLIEKVLMRGSAHAEVESLFGNLTVISVALACTGLLILYAGSREKGAADTENLGSRASFWIGVVQGLCLPFRGFSRSGATISTGLILGIGRAKAEEFSFALAVVLTPFVLLREIHRLWKTQAVLSGSTQDLLQALYPGLMGMVLSFAAGLLALRWLSSWLERGRWKWFGYYCLIMAVVIAFFRNS